MELKHPSPSIYVGFEEIGLYLDESSDSKELHRFGRDWFFLKSIASTPIFNNPKIQKVVDVA